MSYGYKLLSNWTDLEVTFPQCKKIKKRSKKPKQTEKKHKKKTNILNKHTNTRKAVLVVWVNVHGNFLFLLLQIRAQSMYFHGSQQ